MGRLANHLATNNEGEAKGRVFVCVCVCVRERELEGVNVCVYKVCSVNM